MALPLSRNKTYSALDQVRSVDLNEIQDWIIAMYGNIHTPTSPRIVPGLDAAVISNWAVDASLGYVAATPSTAGSIYVPLPVHVGERISSVVVVGATGGTLADMVCSLRRQNCASGAARPGTETILVANTNWPALNTVQKLTLTPASPEDVVADKHYYLRIASANNANEKQLFRVEINYTRP